jgi:hypothetical protein
MSTPLLFQKNLFWESDTKSIETLSRYFDVQEITPEEIILTPQSWEGEFRGSLFLASKLSRTEAWTNAINWAPKLRKEMVSPHFHFQSLDYLLETETNWPKFVRPASGNKIFSGNVHTKETLSIEREFLLQKNVEDTLLTLIAPPVSIEKEWRLVFIANQYISGSQYMENNQISISPEIPPHVIEYGKFLFEKLHHPWIVIDVGSIQNKLCLIEINQIETSSFYAADLDKIYKTWKQNA